MTWLRLAIANLTLAPLTSAINILLMALGTASIVLLLLVGTQLASTMSRDAKGIDLVLGAPGSPVQLILAAVYHADVPPGNIRYTDAQRWAEDPRVARAIPLSLGDSFQGFRIVGTQPEYISHYGARFASGNGWDAPMEAVLGSAVAASTGALVGDTFAGAHGLVAGGHEHEASPYRIVGTLAPTGTVLDRLVVTSLDSVWDLHDVARGEHSDEQEHGAEDEHGGEDEHQHAAEPEHNQDADHDDHAHDEHTQEDEHAHDDADLHDEEHAHDSDHAHEDDHAHDTDDHHADGEAHTHAGEHHAEAGQAHDDDHDAADQTADVDITAMLLTYRSPLAATTLPREIQAGGTLQAAAPAFEVARVLQLIGVGIRALNAFGWVLVVTAALSIFAALYGSLRTRRGELAMLRCLGATRSELVLYLVLEGLLLSILGVGLGYLAGHVITEGVGGWLAATRGVSMTGWTWAPGETALLLGLAGVGLVSALIPAIQAYRTDVARTLAES